jgi:hypothetical protein
MLFLPNTTAREIFELIAGRNRPMIAALELCIEELQRVPKDDPDIQCALRCAIKARELELGFQANAPKE